MLAQSTKTPSAFWKTIRSNVKSQHQGQVIKITPRNEVLPLSFGQERLWLIEQLHAQTIAHNLCAIYRFDGRLDVDRLEKSIQCIVQRHEILRTTFSVIKGQPQQIIAKKLMIKLQINTLGHLSEEQQKSAIHQHMSNEVQQPFELTVTPLIRFKLLCLSNHQAILLKTSHHICSDRWSESMFMRELASLYGALSEQKPLNLPQLSIQYADFAADQRQRIQGKNLQTQLDYWRAQLGQNLQTPQLPTDSALPTTANYQGKTHYILFPKQLTQSLKQFGYQAGLSLFSILLAAFKILLFRYSSQQDMVIVTPVAGRHRIETKKLIGYFNNMVLIRTQLNTDLSFRNIMTQVADLTSDALAHQELPLQYLADNLNISGAILSRVMFTLQNVPNQPLKMGDVNITPLDMDQEVSNFDLSLSIKMMPEGLKGVMRYKIDLFKTRTINTLLNEFQHVLEHMVTDPDAPLSEHMLSISHQPIVEQPKAAIKSYTAPRNQMEQTLATLWQDVLGIEKVDIRTPFTDLGGRSIAMIQVQVFLQKVLNQDILATELFKHSTIVKMARYLDGIKNNETDSSPINERNKRQKDAIKRKRNQVLQSRRRLDE